MTEAEWLACQDPQTMMGYVREARISERKQRLIAVATAYLLWDQMPAPILCEAVQFAEKRADRLVNGEQVDAFRQRFLDYLWNAPEDQKAFNQSTANHGILRSVLCTAPHIEWHGLGFGILWRAVIRAVGVGRLIHIIRDVVDSLPFRPARISPAWLSWNDGTVPRLARAIYEGRAFDRLPVLADALQDAGCADPEILSHCRDPGPHVRGCWVVDLLLGKE